MRKAWLPLILLAVPILGPSLAVLLSGRGLNLFFEQLFARSAALYLVAVLAWLAVANVKRIEPPARTAKALAVGGLFSALLFIASASLWMTAADINVLKKNPVVSSLSELKSQWETPWGQRSRGIFVHGVLKRGGVDGDAPQTLTYYSYRDGGASSSYFPLTLTMVLQDGGEVEAGCIQQVAGAVNWPDGERAFSRGLKEGDPVIVWGDPAKFQAVGSGAESYGVQQPRAIIHGTADQLEKLFLEPARRSARPVGWMALLVLLLSWLPLAGARRLSKDATGA